MAKKDDGFFEDLAALPWWFSIAFGVIVYGAMRFGAPALHVDDPVLASVLRLLPDYAWIAALFLLPAGRSALNAAAKRQMLDRQRGFATIRSLSWKAFEEVVAEAFRRSGYAVVENARAGPDGGVDVTLRRDGNLYLVQCKHWPDKKVGVKVVREMLGLVAAHGADGAIVVTSGTFTAEARAFAANTRVDLIEGRRLAEMVEQVQKRPAPAVVAPAPSLEAGSVRACIRCGSEMKLRQAKRGPNAGSTFWGCARFPSCRYSESV
jgi:restriction system protein